MHRVSAHLYAWQSLLPNPDADISFLLAKEFLANPDAFIAAAAPAAVDDAPEAAKEEAKEEEQEEESDGDMVNAR